METNNLNITTRDRRREYQERCKQPPVTTPEEPHPFEGLRALAWLIIGMTLLYIGIALWVFYG